MVMTCEEAVQWTIAYHRMLMSQGHTDGYTGDDFVEWAAATVTEFLRGAKVSEELRRWVRGL
jgi:hypothetical protein